MREQSPGALSLIAGWVPVVSLAVLADWTLNRRAMDHRAKHGHIYLPIDVLVMAVLLSAAALCVPLIWILLWRHSNRKDKHARRTAEGMGEDIWC